MCQKHCNHWVRPMGRCSPLQLGLSSQSREIHPWGMKKFSCDGPVYHCQSFFVIGMAALEVNCNFWAMWFLLFKKRTNNRPKWKEIRKLTPLFVKWLIGILFYVLEVPTAAIRVDVFVCVYMCVLIIYKRCFKRLNKCLIRLAKVFFSCQVLETVFYSKL